MRIIDYLAAAIFITLGLWIQQHLFLSWDVLWLMQCAEKWLHGGTYFHDFFETNPPLIIYLSTIPLGLAHFFHGDWVVSMRLFITIIGLGSLFLCQFLGGYCRNFTTTRIPLSFLALLFFILPSYEFGQREHLMVMLTMPYWLLNIYQLQQIYFSKKIRISIAVLAAIGLALKPYFLIAWLLVTLYSCYQRHSWQSWRSLENLIIYSFMLVYLIGIAFLTPTYYPLMLPIIHTVYQHYALNWIHLLPNSVTVTALICVALAWALKDSIKEKHTAHVLLLLSLSFLGSYFMQGEPWYYHLIPSLTFSILLLLLLLIAMQQKIFMAICIGLLLLLFPFYSYFILTFNHLLEFKSKDSVPNQMIAFMQHYPTSVKFFQFDLFLSPWPTVAYLTQSTSVNRFPRMWLLPEALKNDKYKELIFKLVTADIQQHQPQFIFVNNQQTEPYLAQPFNFIDYFKQYPPFAKEWRHYHYVRTIDYIEIFQKK